MSARSAFPAAVLLAAMAVVPARAQEPPSVPEQPNPAPAQVVERSRAERRDGGAVSVRAPRAREDNAAQDVRTRVRPAVEVDTAAPAANAAFEEEQGGRRRSGGGGSGGATRGGGGSAGGGGRAAGGDSGARPRGGVRAPDSGGDSGRGGRDTGAGQAVPRGRAGRPAQVYAPSYGRRYYTGIGGLGYYAYDPWSWYAGYGGLGYGGYGWGGFYGNQWGGYYGNQWGGGYANQWGGGYGAYGGPYGWSIGGVRFKVNPKDAEVYVDGYYAGIVDDFDGVWQQLRLDDGGYHIEVRKPGLDTLTFDVRVQPGRTITYRGEMTAAP